VIKLLYISTYSSNIHQVYKFTMHIEIPPDLLYIKSIVSKGSDRCTVKNLGRNIVLVIQSCIFCFMLRGLGHCRSGFYFLENYRNFSRIKNHTIESMTSDNFRGSGADPNTYLMPCNLLSFKRFVRRLSICL
jgi:hypothetical protein